VKTLLKSFHIYQSYCKKNLAQFFLAHPVQATYVAYTSVVGPLLQRVTSNGDVASKKTMLHRVSKNAQHCFWQNFVKFLSTVIIFLAQRWPRR